MHTYIYIYMHMNIHIHIQYVSIRNTTCSSDGEEKIISTILRPETGFVYNVITNIQHRTKIVKNIVIYIFEPAMYV